MSFICEFCQRNFTNQASCTRHTKRCCVIIDLPSSDEEVSSDIMLIESESEKINNSSPEVKK
jgi:hypothetical protein